MSISSDFLLSAPMVRISSVSRKRIIIMQLTCTCMLFQNSVSQIKSWMCFLSETVKHFNDFDLKFNRYSCKISEIMYNFSITGLQ